MVVRTLDRDGRICYVTPRGFVTGWEAPRPMRWTSYRYDPTAWHGMADYWNWNGGMYDTLREALADL